MSSTNYAKSRLVLTKNLRQLSRPRKTSQLVRKLASRGVRNRLFIGALLTVMHVGDLERTIHDINVVKPKEASIEDV
jgi:hypothetical protein